MIYAEFEYPNGETSNLTYPKLAIGLRRENKRPFRMVITGCRNNTVDKRSVNRWIQMISFNVVQHKGVKTVEINIDNY